jgi:hypothetical protein
MPFPIIPLITTVVGLITRKGPNAKANAGGLAGAILGGAGSFVLLDQFGAGLVEGAGSSLNELGVVIGATVIGGVVNWIITWIGPKNSE